MFFFTIITFFLVQSSLAENDKEYSVFNYEDRDRPYQAKIMDVDNDAGAKKLLYLLSKYGRDSEKLRSNFVDADEEFEPPMDKREKNSDFVRFGRSDQKFLRFGRNLARAVRDKENYLRFGRSIGEKDPISDAKPTPKDIFVRFGRDPNFL